MCGFFGGFPEEKFVDDAYDVLLGIESLEEHGLPLYGDVEYLRDAADTEDGCQFAFLFGVGLIEIDLSFVLVGQLFHDGGESFARSAPYGIEVEDDGFLSGEAPLPLGGIVEDVGLEVVSSEVVDLCLGGCEEAQ